MRHRAALACATALCIWPAWATAQLLGDRTECAVRAEGDITAEANVNCGYQPEEVSALIAEATAPLKELNAAQMDEIVRLAGEARSAGLSVERVVVLARRIAKDVPDIDGAFAELERAVEVAIEVQARGKAGLDGDEFIDAVLARMAELSAKGLEDEAAAEVDRALAELEAQAKRQKLALLDAGLRADILRRNPASAAQRVAEKVELDTPDPTRLFAALRAEQEVWYTRGRDRGLNFDLEISIELARLALAHARDADERGAALNELAIPLATLGTRESGTARLEEAVGAYRAALDERSRERVPLDWAMIQNNLGAALATLGERESGTARLEEAVAAFRAALEERTREQEPLDWAGTQNNLGNALRTLGARESGTARLEEAVAAYRAALKEWTRERVPLGWAMTQNNLGNALATLGGRESGTARLEEAVAVYRAALEEWTRERVPLDWAMTQNNLGNALAELGERESGTARLEEAVAAYRAALEERTRERVPLDWATATGNQGVALRVLAERTSDAAMARLALDQITTAETVMRAGGHIPRADYYAGQLPAAEALIASLAE